MQENTIKEGHSKKYFDIIANEWDQMRKDFFPDDLCKIVADKLNVQKGKLAVDAGAGSGFITKELLHRELKVLAVDQSPKMIFELEKKFAGENLTTIIGDSTDFKIANNSVDYVFANMFLHHVESPIETIQEMHRVLKPGGSVCISDLDAHSHQFLLTEHNDRWMGFDRKDIRKWFSNSGFNDIQVECLSMDCCSTSATSDDTAEISIFCAMGMK